MGRGSRPLCRVGPKTNAVPQANSLVILLLVMHNLHLKYNVGFMMLLDGRLLLLTFNLTV